MNVLNNAGQLCGEHLVTWVNRRFVAHVLLAGKGALSPRYHSEYGKAALKKVVKAFGGKPVVEIQDDYAPKRSSSWKGAPFLYLFTHFSDWASPVCRGDGKWPVPVFALPLDFRDKESLLFWQRSYRDHDSIWIGSGALEIDAYRELADGHSGLSSDGRDLCTEIESKTGVPTFYYLMRYWSRTKHEDQRRCPGCGNDWRTDIEKDSSNKFWQFHFKCDPCRLVSHMGVSNDGGRHVRIGEYESRKTVR